MLELRLAPSFVHCSSSSDSSDYLLFHVGSVQVLVRWGIQHGTSVIPKASSESHLHSNLDVLNWELSKDDFHAISSIKIQARAQSHCSCDIELMQVQQLWHILRTVCQADHHF